MDSFVRFGSLQKWHTPINRIGRSPASSMCSSRLIHTLSRSSASFIKKRLNIGWWICDSNHLEALLALYNTGIAWLWSTSCTSCTSLKVVIFLMFMIYYGSLPNSGCNQNFLAEGLVNRAQLVTKSKGWCLLKRNDRLKLCCAAGGSLLHTPKSVRNSW